MLEKIDQTMIWKNHEKVKHLLYMQAESTAAAVDKAAAVLVWKLAFTLRV